MDFVRGLCEYSVPGADPSRATRARMTGQTAELILAGTVGYRAQVAAHLPLPETFNGWPIDRSNEVLPGEVHVVDSDGQLVRRFKQQSV